MDHYKRPNLTDEQRLSWLRLSRCERVGPITFRELLARFGTADAALEALPTLANRAGSKISARICTKTEAEDEMAAAEKMEVRYIAYGEVDYPSILRSIGDHPPLLATKGEPVWKDRASIAIVGSRNASTVGSKIAKTIAHELGEAGLLIISGLARGIDTQAHYGSLQSGTIAVLPCGHGRVYPKENQKLLEDILANGGAIVSERAHGSEPRAQDFRQRNRIISGISIAVVIIEAAHRSGSLITARLASEQGRQVFSVPGSPLDPRAFGTNALIREGATLIRNAEDVMDDIAPMMSKASHGPDQAPFRFENEQAEGATNSELESDISRQAPENAYEILVQGLSPTPISVDDLISFSKLSTADVLATLSDLELADRIERHTGNRVALKV